MERHKKYQSIAGNGISVAGENIIKGKGRVKNLFISVDCACGVSFNDGDFVEIGAACSYNFEEFCSSVVIDTADIGYKFSGEVVYCTLGCSNGSGISGKSAYELAVEDGFEGTPEEWMESLKGDAGDKGDKGDKGDSILTNYELEKLRAQLAWADAKVGIEYWTGKTVGDTGRKIYGKIITFGAFIVGAISIPHGISNLVVDSNIKSTITISSGNLIMIVNYQGPSGFISYGIVNTDIVLTSTANWPNCKDNKITMEYTCSDR